MNEKKIRMVGDRKSLLMADENLNITKDIMSILNKSLKSIKLDFDVGDPREFAPDWQDEGVYLVNWNKRKNVMEVEGDARDLYKWLHTTFGLSKKEAKDAMRTAK